MNSRADALHAYYPKVLRYVRGQLRGGHDSEDVTQEAVAAAIEALTHTSHMAPPTLGWLYTVARRRLIDARRRRITTTSLEFAPEPTTSDPEYGYVVADALSAALNSLSAAQQSVIVLRLLEGRSFAEIAALLDISEDSCRMRFMRGLKRVRDHFEKEGLRP